jgi:predicted kinase
VTGRSHLVLVGGRSGVGKTTVAAEVHAQLVARDVRHCVVEGDSLDLAHPAPWTQGLDLAERNLAAVWRNYRDAGYRRLVLTGTAVVQADVVRSLVLAMGDDPEVTAVLLTAGDGTALDRLRRREVGSALDAHVQRSAEAAHRLEELAPAWVTRLPTDGRTVPQLAAQVIALAGWLP